MSRKIPKDAVIRIEGGVKTDLLLLKEALPHEVFYERIKDPGDVVKALVRLYKEKKIGMLSHNIPSESETNLDKHGQEFKDMQWLTQHLEAQAVTMNNLFLFVCKENGLDPISMHRSFDNYERAIKKGFN